MNVYAAAFEEYIKSHPLKSGHVELESVLEGFRVGGRWGLEAR